MNNEELIAKIKAEIERRIDIIKPKPGQGFILCEQITKQLKELLSFLSTLESEKPMELEEELKKEIEKKYDQAKWGYVDGVGAVVMDKDQFIRIARHFAKWGADHTPLPEDTVLFQKGVEEGKRLMREDYPKWYKVQRGSCFDKYTNFILSAREGHFYCSSMEVPRDGYILLVDELERLPKEDEK